MVGGIQDRERPPRGEALFDRALGHGFITRLARLSLRAPLRVLAYHEIRDVSGFRAQMEHMVERYRPVSAREVVAWMGGADLPSGAVWVTFDDGDPSVVEAGLPILDEVGVTATMFICPGLIDGDTPFWWQTVELADPSRVAGLKHIPDDERRRIVENIREDLTERKGHVPSRPQLTTAQLETWIDRGQEIGNHTWDHPMLDRCDDDEQVRQVRLAHEWIADRVPGAPPIFAYPNGNPAAAADAALEELGYELWALFDHRMSTRPDDRRLSRLRTNADADLARFRAIVSGVHPTVHRLRGGR